MKSKRPTVGEVKRLKTSIEWYKRTRRRESRHLEIANDEITHLEAIIRHSCATVLQVGPDNSPSWKLPRVRTPMGSLVGLD